MAKVNLKSGEILKGHRGASIPGEREQWRTWARQLAPDTPQSVKVWAERCLFLIQDLEDIDNGKG